MGKRSATVAKWINRDLVVADGGPLDGRWYFAEDWDQLRRAEKAMGRVLPYRRTEDFDQHPDEPTSGRVWQYAPPRSAT